MKTLKDAKVGETVKATKLTGEGPVKRRIMDMGITKGVEIYVRKVAPLGDPVEVTVRGYELSLRKEENYGSENCIGRKPKLRKNDIVQCIDRFQSVCW